MGNADAPVGRLRLRTFGGLSVQSECYEALSEAANRRRPLALLAFVAAAGTSGVSRDVACAMFWPESDSEHGRNTLKQTLFRIRQDLRRPDILLGGGELRLNPEVIASDISEFKEALQAGDLERAVSLFSGPFLDGVHLRDAPEFERWVENERTRLAAQAEGALRKLAEGAERRGDHEPSAQWWRRLTTLNPADSRAAVGLMRSLVASGDRAAAIRHARVHAAYLQAELGAQPDVSVITFAKDLQGKIERPASLTDAAVTRAPRGRGIPATPSSDTTTAPVAPTPNQSAVEQPSLAPQRLDWKIAVTAAVIVVGVVAGALYTRAKEARGETALSRGKQILVIAPFETSSSDASSASLETGLVDLLGATLSGDTATWMIADPNTFLVSWRRAESSTGAGLSIDQALAVARSESATRLARGSIVNSRGHLVIMASLLNVANGQSLGKAEVSGSADSVAELSDRLAAELLALQAGEAEGSVQILGSTPLNAVRSYLAGREAFRRADYEEAVQLLKTALLQDSTFALAASELGRIAGWVGDDANRRRAYEIAWRNRDRLGAIDLEIAHAMLGPNYPAGSTRAEWLASWERVARLQPEQPGGWYEAGDLLFHNPWLGGRDDRQGLERAKALFERALSKAPDYWPAQQHLIQLVAHRGDTAALETILTSADSVRPSSDLSAFLKWRAAVLVGDGGRKAVWTDLDRESPLVLQWVAISAQEDGLPLEPAAAAIERGLAHAATEQERVDALLSRHSLALNSGDALTAKAATLSLRASNLGRPNGRAMAVMDVVFAGVPADSDATAAARELAESSALPIGAPAAQWEQPLLDGCFLGHWYLWSGDLRSTASTAARLRSAATRYPRELWSPEIKTCSLLLESSLALRDARMVAAVVDSLEVQLTGGTYMTSRLLWDITVLSSARVLESAGRPARAYEAIRRRNWFYRWPHYLARQLYEDGRLAMLTGDTAAAIAAYKHYIALRRSPAPPFVAEASQARRSLDRISSR